MDQEVGRYQIQEELRRDATRVVYAAVDRETGRRVAIQQIPLASFPDPPTRSRAFVRLLGEVEAAASLIHPNIAATYEALEEGEFAYVATELVEGVTFAELARRQRLTSGESLIRILRQVADGLDYAHRRGIVHGGVEPSTLLLTGLPDARDAVAKVADFAVAKFVLHDLTREGNAVASPNYLSPEQVQDTPVDARSDEFSFAAVVYELLTGTKPFSAQQLAAVFYAICKQDPPAANQLNPALSEATAKVLRHGLMKDPKQRFASCGEFVGALSVALAEAPAAAEPVAALYEGERALAFESEVKPAEFSTVPAGAAELREEAATAQYISPTRYRRNATAEYEEVPVGRRAAARQGGSSGSRKLLLILLMFFAIGATIVFIVFSNSGPTVPVQVLDSKEGPVTPPPDGMEVKSSGRRLGSSPREPSERAVEKKSQSAAPALRSPTDNATAPAAPSTAAPIGGYTTEVELLTQPPGAKMVVDDRPDLTCTAPCTLNLQNGRHTAAAELAGFNVARRIFNVPDDDSLFINLGKSMGVLVVTSTQSGCSVLVDGRPSGSTPATLHLTAGAHRIAVVSRATRHEETVQVETDGFDVERFICQ